MNSTDNILISMILGTVVVGYYSNYLMITTAINAFIILIAQSLLASIGNMNATEDSEKKLTVFKCLMLLFFGVGTFCSCCFLSMFNDFVSIWLVSYGKEYILSNGVVCAITFNFFVSCLMNPIWMFREATGLFKEVKYSMSVAAALNIILSIIFGHIMGLAGIIAATAISKLLTNFWFEPKKIFSIIFGMSSRQYWIATAKYSLCTLLSMAGTMIVCGFLGHTFLSIALKIIISFVFTCLKFTLANMKSPEVMYLKQSLFKPILAKFNEHYLFFTHSFTQLEPCILMVFG
jgi:O-antigen/teichoic acid export membrane protein